MHSDPVLFDCLGRFRLSLGAHDQPGSLCSKPLVCALDYLVTNHGSQMLQSVYVASVVTQDFTARCSAGLEDFIRLLRWLVACAGEHLRNSMKSFLFPDGYPELRPEL